MIDLHIQDLEVYFGRTCIIDGITLTAHSGEVLGLIGPNGAGKSTLLRTAACLVPAARGQVMAGTEDVRALRHRPRAQLLSFLPQDTQVAANFRVHDLVALGRYAHLSRWSAPGPDDTRCVDAALERAGVTTFAQRRIGTLSGGQRQLVMLAKLLAQNARIALLDEPVSALDIAYQLQVMRLLRTLAEDGHTVVAVLHDLNLASRCCDRLALLHHGRLHGLGAPQEVLTTDSIGTVYGVRCRIDPDPGTGRPTVTAQL